MAPSVAQTPIVQSDPSVISKSVKAPLKSSGSLDQYQKRDVTPVIGTEFAPGTQLTELLSAPNSDDLIRDLAILGNHSLYNEPNSQYLNAA